MDEKDDPLRSICRWCGRPIDGYSTGYDNRPLWRHADGNANCGIIAAPTPKGS